MFQDTHASPAGTTGYDATRTNGVDYGLTVLDTGLERLGLRLDELTKRLVSVCVARPENNEGVCKSASPEPTRCPLGETLTAKGQRAHFMADRIEYILASLDV